MFQIQVYPKWLSYLFYLTLKYYEPRMPHTNTLVYLLNIPYIKKLMSIAQRRGTTRKVDSSINTNDISPLPQQLSMNSDGCSMYIKIKTTYFRIYNKPTINSRR